MTRKLTAKQEAATLSLAQAIAQRNRAQGVLEEVIRRRVADVLAGLELRYPGHKFEVHDNMGSTRIYSKPAIEAHKCARALEDITNLMEEGEIVIRSLELGIVRAST